TAPGKRVAFLNGFLPFLRNQLAEQLIADKLAVPASLTSPLTRLLLTDFLTVGTPAVPAMQAFKALRLAPAGAGPGWTGYLIPPADGAYVFSALGDVQPPAITLDGQSIAFTVQQEDPSNVWSS